MDEIKAKEKSHEREIKSHYCFGFINSDCRLIIICRAVCVRVRVKVGLVVGLDLGLG